MIERVLQASGAITKKYWGTDEQVADFRIPSPNHFQFESIFILCRKLVYATMNQGGVLRFDS